MCVCVWGQGAPSQRGDRSSGADGGRGRLKSTPRQQRVLGPSLGLESEWVRVPDTHTHGGSQHRDVRPPVSLVSSPLPRQTPHLHPEAPPAALPEATPSVHRGFRHGSR